MALLSVKTYLALLWGISVLFAVESMSASVSTAEPRKPAEISVAAPAETTVSPTVETVEAVVTHGTDVASDLVAVNTVAAATSSTDPSHSTTKPVEDQMNQQPPTASTDMAAPATASATTVAVSSPWPTSTVKPEVTSQLSPTTSPANSAPAPVVIQTPSSPSASTTTATTANPTSGAAPVFDPTRSETSTTSAEILSPSQPVSGTRTPTSTSQFPDTAGSTAEPPTISLSTDSPISTTNVPTTTTNVPTTTTNVPTNTTTVPTTITNFSTITNVSTINVPTTTTNVSTITNVSTTIDVSTTNVPTTTSIVSTITDVSSTTTNVPTTTTNVSTTNASTSPAAILIPHVPRPTTKSTPATTAAPREVSKSPPSTEVQPCSARGVVKHCLIAVASLAALATLFMVSTIVLCTKLSSRKYKVRSPQPATEMMCISALLPERSHATYSRQRNPVSNGVLVIHGGADSDDDGGDNLTLSSFLPENDRYV